MAKLKNKPQIFISCACGLAFLFLLYDILYDIFHHSTREESAIWQYELALDLLGIVVISAAFVFFVTRRARSGMTLLIEEMMDSIISGVLRFDTQGNLTLSNNAARLMLKNSDYQTYKSFLNFIYDHSLEIQDQTNLYSDMNRQELAKLLFREVIRLGQDRIILVQIYQKKNGEIVSILTDISLMKKHVDEISIEGGENRIILSAIEASGAGILIASAETEKITFSNELYLKNISSKRRGASDLKLIDVLRDDFDVIERDVDELLLKAKQNGNLSNIWFKSKDPLGNYNWFCTDILYFIDANKNGFFILFFLDQTELNLEQEKKHREQKLEAVSKLGGNIAHDFNNVLSLIEGYAKLVQKNVERGQDSQQFLNHIHTAVKRGTDITNRLMLIGNKNTEVKVRLDLCACVREMEGYIVSRIPSNIGFTLNVQPKPCFISSSENGIRQIILNLISNACDAMAEGGDLIVEVADADQSQYIAMGNTIVRGRNYALLRVIDSGHGISPEHMSNIYEPFFSTKGTDQNSGLGLSLVYSIVKDVDGLIDVRSTIDLGTSITILIPIHT